MTSRIPCTRETLDALREFKTGLDIDANYDDAIRFMLELLKDSEKDNLLAGRNLHDDFKKWQKAKK